MPIQDPTLLLSVVYKLIAITIGFGIIYLGYRLFCIGVYEKAGELRAAWGETRLILKQVAPGIFFALFGVIVISISLWKGIGIETETLGDYSVLGLTAPDPEIKGILEKVVSCKSIPEAERGKLRKWYTKKRISVRIYIPPEHRKPDV